MLREANETRSPRALPCFSLLLALFESFALVFLPDLFSYFLVIDCFYNNKKLSQLGHAVRKGKLVKTVSVYFKTYEKNNRKISAKNTGFPFFCYKAFAPL